MAPGAVLIAGCGDVGTTLARMLAADGRPVYALTRQARTWPPGVVGIAADLGDPARYRAALSACVAVVVLASPDARTESAYRALYLDAVGRLLEAARALPSPPRVLLASSTAVYGAEDGRWVDEDDDPAPTGFNGRVLLEAEARLAACGLTTLALRYGGIYGPGREYLLRRATAPDARCQAEPPRYTNRVHVEDAARAARHLLDHAHPAAVYNVVDDAPAAECEVLSHLAQALGRPPPTPLRCPGADAGKRVRNTRLRATGFAFVHPDYRSGYAELLESFR